MVAKPEKSNIESVFSEAFHGIFASARADFTLPLTHYPASGSRAETHKK